MAGAYFLFVGISFINSPAEINSLKVKDDQLLNTLDSVDISKLITPVCQVL